MAQSWLWDSQITVKKKKKKWLVDFNAGKTQLVSCDQSNNTGAIDVKMDGSVLEENSSFKFQGLTSSSKTTYKKIRAMICSMKFLSPEFAQYLYKSNIRPCMEYRCHVWTGALSCYLELLDKLQKQICRTVGPSLAAFLNLGTSSKCSWLKSSM